MARTETTSARVAAIAGRILQAKKTVGGIVIWDGDSWYAVRNQDVRSICASALTQTRPKRRARGKS